MADINIDPLDKKILSLLQADARKPYLEIARELGVAGGTVNSRVRRLKEAGVIEGTRLGINGEKLGYKLSSFIGVTVDQAGMFQAVADQLAKLNEVVEVHYTTGDYSLFIRVMVQGTKELHELLSTKIQRIPHVQSTHTLIILNSLLNRELPL